MPARRDRRVTVLAPETIESLINTGEAAELAGVSPPAISQWKRRGHLAPAGIDHRGRPLYRWIDVARAEHRTRHAARRDR